MPVDPIQIMDFRQAITASDFIAEGEARFDGGVKGKLRQASGAEYNGVTIRFKYIRKEGDTKIYHWIITVADVVPRNELHTLIVKAVDPQNPARDTAELDLSNQGGAPRAGRFGAVFIVFPPPQTPLTQQQKQQLVANGQLTQGHNIVSVRMNNVDGQLIPAGRSMWVAVFPPLATGMYSLVAVDDAGHSATSDELEVP